MATIIYDESQKEAVNLDNVDYIKIERGNHKIVFYKMEPAEGGQIVASITWKFDSMPLTERRFNQIMKEFGTVLT